MLNRAFDFNDIEGQEGVLSQIDRDVYTVTEDWLGMNLYRVSTYAKLEEPNQYKVTLLRVEAPKGESFDELQQTFYATPLTLYNSLTLAEGVNCQGMTCYIASWCVQNGYVYTINYTTRHTNITVEYKGEWYTFDFTDNRTITKE